MRNLLLLAVLGLASLASAAVKLTVDAANGDKVGGERTFVVGVASPDEITSVEFYIGDDLRDTDSSQPYEFRLDTLAEQEGPVKVSFAAYTSKGDTAKVTLDLVIDNELGKGAPFFVAQAQAALSDSKWDVALTAGRVALRIDPKLSSARIAVARAYLGKNVLDSAQKFVEEVVAEEPKNIEALELLAGIRVRSAIMVTNRGGDKNATLDLIRQTLAAAAAAQRSVYDLRLDAFGSITNANRLNYADLALRAGRYSLAANTLRDVFRRDDRVAEVANRYVYALIRSSRWAEAARVMDVHQRRGTPDGVGQSLQAILANYRGDTATATEAMRQAVVNGGASMAVPTAQAYIFLREANFKDLRPVANRLSTDAGNTSVGNYYVAAALFQANEFEPSRLRFELAVLEDPANVDMYLQKANQAIAFSYQTGLSEDDKKFQRRSARVYFEVALAANPSSFEALSGLAIVDLLDGKPADAIPRARAAVAAGPEYAAGHYVLSLVLSNSAQRAERAVIAQEAELASAQAENRKADVDRLTSEIKGNKAIAARLNADTTAAIAAAGKFDTLNLDGASIPDAFRAWNFFARFGRGALLLYP